MTPVMEMFAMVLTVAVGFAALGFWMWMLVDCLVREPREGNNRLIWTLVIVFTKVLGAALYWFHRRRRRELVFGAGPS